MVMMVGGITFLMTSFAAISQSNAKRVLAYSTVANLGFDFSLCRNRKLCCCLGSYHVDHIPRCYKSLLFLCVGTAEHNIGSRDIEDMDGLFGRMPRLATL